LKSSPFRNAYSSISLLIFFLSALFPLGVCAGKNCSALVLVNRESADYREFEKFLQPYLTQFGLVHEVFDISKKKLENSISDFSLVIIGHRSFDPSRRFFSSEDEKILLAALQKGTGFVSLDGLLCGWQGENSHPLYDFPQQIFSCSYRKEATASSITIGASRTQDSSSQAHYIISASQVPRTITLKKNISLQAIIPGVKADILASAGDNPLLLVSTVGEGRAVLFTTAEWIDPAVKGRIYGMDDLLWKSLVWAARKPFLMRAMPHFLAFRVDDVSGYGKGSNRHLGWVEVANRFGLKPWLGIFIDDLRKDPEAVSTLAELTQTGMATAFPHARTWREFFFLDEPLLTDGAERNIAGKPWTNEKMTANFNEADAFFAKNKILQSKVALPHFYEFGINNFDGLIRWGAEFVGTVLIPGQGYGAPMPAAGPYLSVEPLRPSNSKDPVLIADWLEVPNHPEFHRKFFNFDLEVRDVTGYEWAPSGVPVDEAIRRGVEESKREWDSLLPAVLFTHESDHIQHIDPQDWEKILKGVMDQLTPYGPIPVTLDYLCQYLRALKTSTAVSTTLDESEDGSGTVTFEGESDLTTSCILFEGSGEEISQKVFAIHPFKGRITFEW
jgi:hypothetical protein